MYSHILSYFLYSRFRFEVIGNLQSSAAYQYLQSCKLSPVLLKDAGHVLFTRKQT